MKKLSFILVVMVSVMILSVQTVSAVVSTTTPTATPVATTAPTAKPKVVAPAAKVNALTRAKDSGVAIFNNHFLAKLNEIETKVNVNTLLGADAKSQLLKKIEEERTWFTAERDSIAGKNTVEEVRTVVKTARERYTEVSKTIYLLHVGAGYVNALEKVIANLENNLLETFAEKIAVLESKGFDMTTEKELLLKSAGEVAAAKAKVSEIRNSTTIVQARTAYQSARDSLKSARQDLVEILKTLKNKLEAASTTGTATQTPTATVTQ